MNGIGRKESYREIAKRRIVNDFRVYNREYYDDNRKQNYIPFLQIVLPGRGEFLPAETAQCQY
jgi:hypothetical protein